MDSLAFAKTKSLDDIPNTARTLTRLIYRPACCQCVYLVYHRFQKCEAAPKYLSWLEKQVGLCIEAGVVEGYY